MPAEWISYLLLIFYFCWLGTLFYKSIKYGSWTAVVFDAPIKQTVGVIQITEPCKASLEVYVLGQNSANKLVGLLLTKEIRLSSTLSRLEVENLVKLLQLANQENSSVAKKIGKIPASKSCRCPVAVHNRGQDSSNKSVSFEFISVRSHHVPISKPEVQKLIELLQHAIAENFNSPIPSIFH